MSGLDLGTLGLTQVDGEHNPVTPEPAAPAVPVVPEPAPAAVLEPPAPLVEPPAEDEPIVVPPGAENPDAVRNAIQAERARARAAYAKAKDLETRLRAIEEANMPLEDRLRAATARAEQAEGAFLRYKVGARHNLPETLVDRLRGQTEEELEGDAQSLLSQLNIAAPAAPAPGPAPTTPGYQQPPPAPPDDPAKAHGQFLAGLFSGAQQ